jgi:hypothetical protein
MTEEKKPKQKYVRVTKALMAEIAERLGRAKACCASATKKACRHTSQSPRL